MLTKTEKAEIRQLTDDSLRAMIRVTTRQVEAPLLIGDRERAAEIRNAAAEQLRERAAIRGL